MLEVRGITAGYGAATILRDVSMSVPEGKLVVVTGPNGHGKTTLLRVLSGLVPMDGGEVEFLGEKLNSKSVTDIVGRGLVHIPQGDLLFVDLSVEQNLFLGAYLKDAWKRRRERVGRVYDLFPRLQERRTQQARTLSGGERRMLAIGRGLMSNAKLLMVDEPALGLAPQLVQEVYGTLDRIARTEATILLAEETLANAKGIADYVYLMDEGHIVREGSLSDISELVLTSTYLGSNGR